MQYDIYHNHVLALCRPRVSLNRLCKSHPGLTRSRQQRPGRFDRTTTTPWPHDGPPRLHPSRTYCMWHVGLPVSRWSPSVGQGIPRAASEFLSMCSYKRLCRRCMMEMVHIRCTDRRDCNHVLSHLFVFVLGFPKYYIFYNYKI